jgi:hypothetical protein
MDLSMEFTVDQMRHIRQEVDRSVHATGIQERSLGDEIACVSCTIGLNVALGAVIAGAIAAIIATGGVAAAPIAAAVATISAVIGISATVVTAVLSGAALAGIGTALELAIQGLCKAMNACH